jgi:hypothetical protein
MVGISVGIDEDSGKPYILREDFDEAFFFPELREDETFVFDDNQYFFDVLECLKLYLNAKTEKEYLSQLKF